MNLFLLKKGTHSPDAVKKLLALSETKVKTVKNSASSTSVPISHMAHSISASNSRLLLNTSGNAASNQAVNSSNVSISNYSAHDSSNFTQISPKTTTTTTTTSHKHRSVSSSQPINSQHIINNKYNTSHNSNSSNNNSSNIALSSESSSVSTIKLSGSLFVFSLKAILKFEINYLKLI